MLYTVYLNDILSGTCPLDDECLLNTKYMSGICWSLETEKRRLGGKDKDYLTKIWPRSKSMSI